MIAACRVPILLFVCAGACILGARDARAQELTFEIQVSVAGEVSAWHAFGLREDALPGVDGHDLPEPPPPPGTTLRSHLAMFEPLAGLPNRWLRDFRPVDAATGDRIELWQLDIAVGAPGAEVAIALRAPEAIAVPYDLYVFGAGVYYRRLEAPEVVAITMSGASMTFFFELRLDQAVAHERASWGEVKGLFSDPEHR